MGETSAPRPSQALGPFPGPGDLFVLVTLHPTGRLDIRANLPGGDRRNLVQFLRSAADDLAREAGGETPEGLILP